MPIRRRVRRLLLQISLGLGTLAAALPASAAAADCNHNGVADDLEVPPLRFEGGNGFFKGSRTRMLAADFDGDGDADLIDRVVAGEVRVLHNRKDGSLGPLQRIPVAPQNGLAEVADVDGDGKVDLVVIESNFPQSTLFVLRNLDGRTFATATTTIPGGTADLQLADFDGDEDIDAAVRGAVGFNQHRITFLANNGTGQFTYAGALPFEDHVGISEALRAGDVDSDGDADLIFADDLLFIVRNLGGNQFRLDLQYETMRFVNAAAIDDVDADGDPDIVVALDDGRVGILRADGAGGFAPLVSAQLSGSRPLFVGAADIDGDGYSELTATDDQGFLNVIGQQPPSLQLVLLQQFAVTEQTATVGIDTDGVGGLDLAHFQGEAAIVHHGRDDGTVEVAPRAIGFTKAVAGGTAATLNADRYADIVVVHDATNEITTALNDGANAFPVRRSYPLHGKPGPVLAADLDGDRDTDIAVVTETPSELTVLRNRGNGQLDVGVPFDAGNSPKDLLATDIDGDGATDVAVASDSANAVYLYFNDSGALLPPRPVDIGRRAIAITSGDVDGDGKIDLATAGFTDNIISVLRNRGDRKLERSNELLALGVRSVAFANLDDRSGDDLVALTDNGPLAVFINDGSGDFASPVFSDFGDLGFVRTLKAIDIDGDSKDEIVAVGGNGVAVLRSAGSGLGGHVIISARLFFDQFERRVFGAADFDGDGRPDLLVGPSNTDGVLLFPNRSRLPAAADCDADGRPDSCQLAGNDCDINGVPDHCESDADADRVPDPCERCLGKDDHLDGDGDHHPDCLDVCPEVADSLQIDRDSDGHGDACDNCPDSYIKGEPGICGCDETDGDSDQDGVLDCNDLCPLNPSKTHPSFCGCDRFEDAGDNDSDGWINCRDNCRSERNADQADADSDGQGDACDECRNDPLKARRGTCGCGVAETDMDFDSVPDCIDGCPIDRFKSAPGVCGCLARDLDRDSDGVLDCLDGCPGDPNKTEPGRCGCGFPDEDGNGDDLTCPTPTPVASETPHPGRFRTTHRGDLPDANVGDGICAATNGMCTLRAAIQETNALRGPDIVEVTQGIYSLTVAGTAVDDDGVGDLDITDALELVGDGSATTSIDGSRREALEIHAGALVSIRGLSLYNSTLVSNAGMLSLRDVAIRNNSLGGLANTATLDADNCQFSSNESGPGVTNSGTMVICNSAIRGNRGRIAALSNTGDAILIGVDIDDNESRGSFVAAVLNTGTLRLERSALRRSDILGGLPRGAFLNLGDAVIDRSTVVDNSSEAITNQGTLHIVDSVVRDNGITAFPGAESRALHNQGEAMLDRVTISGNRGDFDVGIFNTGDLEMVNSTISGNEAFSDSAGITNRDGSIQLNNVTITSNVAQAAAGLDNQGGTVSIANSILARNLARSGESPDCRGEVQSMGHNLIQDSRGCLILGRKSSDQLGVDPQLDALRLYGGETLTHRPRATSPVIDAGDPATPGTSITACAPVDQLGTSRPQEGFCDIGAFEVRLTDLTPMPTSPRATPTPTPRIRCVGDCDLSSEVHVDEIVTLINIALGQLATGTCFAGDPDASGDVTVDEIIQALTIALVGCR